MKFLIPGKAKSWLPVAADSHFPIQNIPFGIVRDEEEQRLVTRIGDTLVDLFELAEAGLLTGDPEDYFAIETLVVDFGPERLSDIRKELYDLFREGSPRLRDNAEVREAALHPAEGAPMDVPMQIDAFVDFYSGINHASNVGKMFRPDQPPLLPNYRHLPVGYNGRASSVIPSGMPIRRPKGQTKAPNAESPSFGPTKELDFELEMGFFVGKGSEMGEPVPIEKAEDYMVGMVLVNDWSARDVQRWEYQPLGPFLAKSFATSISPWLVTMDALEPFRTQGPIQDPPVLPHLAQSGKGHFDIHLEVWLKTAKMAKPQKICTTNYKELYWSPAQQLAHQCSNGTPIEIGDLYASGTISGESPDSFGSLLELTWRGERKLTMQDTGEERTFLEDGDELTFVGYCQGDGYRVGFGEVRTQIQG